MDLWHPKKARPYVMHVLQDFIRLLKSRHAFPAEKGRFLQILAYLVMIVKLVFSLLAQIIHNVQSVLQENMATFLEVVSAKIACKASFQISLDPQNAKSVLQDFTAAAIILIHVLLVMLASINLLQVNQNVIYVILANTRDFQDRNHVPSANEDTIRLTAV